MLLPLLGRRAFLRLTGDFALLALLPGAALAQILEERPEGAGIFLSPEHMSVLRALCAHWIPGPPDDPDPGAALAGVPDYIDLLLAAFELPRPPIFAGGPFSHRDGGGPNHFRDFIALDALEERVWRTRIEGSRGLPEREWNGAVRGWQQIYTEGLGALDAAARRWLREPFADLGHESRSAILGWLPDGPDDEFLDLAFRHTLEGMYGAPEYGGNRERVGWTYTRWPGDHQPHAWSDAQISNPDPDQLDAVARARVRAREVLGLADEEPDDA